MSFYPKEKGQPSRLAKVSFFRRFLKLAKTKNLSSISFSSQGLAKGDEAEISLCLLEKCKTRHIELTQYSEAKRSSAEFQKAKDELFKAFTKAQLGTWVKKPMEQDEFHISA